MAEETDAMAEEQIESTLVFDVKHYRDYEPFVRVAEGIHERGERKVEYIYDLDTETEPIMLRVQSRFYLNGELKNQSNRNAQVYEVKAGNVQHAGSEFELHQFVQDNFEAGREVALTDVFEDYVEEA